MAAPTFVQTATWTGDGTNGKRSKVIRGMLTVDGTVGAAVGDIPSSLFSGINGAWTKIEQVDGGMNSTNTQAAWFEVEYNDTSILTLNSSGVPTNLAAGTYKIQVRGY